MNYLQSTLDTLQNHEKVVYQFSGGRDSIAGLLALGYPLPAQVYIMHVSTGDEPEETRLLVGMMQARYGDKFIVVQSNSLAVRAMYGHPLPIALSDAPAFADAPATQTQFHCCFRSIMGPAHAAVEAHGFTMVIRGQRLSDVHQSDLRHLDASEGIVYAFPVYDKTDAQIDELCGAYLPSFYGFTSDAPDCKTCTGYWGRGYQKWLEHTDPQLAAERKERIAALLSFIEPILRVGFSEIE